MADENETDGTLDLLPGSAEIYEASALGVRVVEPQDLNGDGQIPYAKSDRVGEAFLPLQDVVLAAPHLNSPDEPPLTAGNLRMMNGCRHADETAVYVIGLFDVLAIEGGRPIGHVVAVLWWRPGQPYNEVSPLIEDAGEAYELYEAERARYAAGYIPPEG